MSTIKSSDEHLTLNADGASKDIKLQSNASEKVIIKSDGNVGLGTSSPDSSLEIYKASTAELMIGSDNGGTAQISLYENNSTTKEATIKYDGFANNLVIGTSGEANAIVIPRDSGNLGLGTTTPQAPVTVKVQDTAVSAGVNFLAEAKGSAGSTGGYYFSSHDLASPRKKQAIVNKKNTGGSTGDYGVGSLLFLVDSNTDDADVSEADSKLEITSDGRGLSQFTAKAWLNLSSGGTPSIDTSHNISSITDRANGMYTFTFSNSMNNSNYCVVAGAHAGAGTNDVTVVQTPESTKGVGSVQCHTMVALNSASTFSDSQDADVNMIIFGD